MLCLGRSIGGCFCKLNGVCGSNCHDLATRGVISFEYGIQNSLQVTNFIRGIGSSKLGDRIVRRIDQCIDSFSRSLMLGTANLEIGRGYGLVGSCDI